MKTVFIILGIYSENGHDFTDILLVTSDINKAAKLINKYNDNMDGYDTIYREEHYIE